MYEWIKNIYIYSSMCIYIYIYIPVLKKEILLFATMWMNLEAIMLSEISQTQKETDMHDFTYMWNLKKS